ncbi:HNH endonuclease [Methylovorus sp. SPW-M1]
MANSTHWSQDQVKLAFHLYCQIPFGKIHSGNKDIIGLAKLIGRTPSAVAMKMLNIASLDPSITSNGRVALGNASALDREVWAAFHDDWEKLALECHGLKSALINDRADTDMDIESETGVEEAVDYSGESRQVLALQRVNQQFFRRMVLSSYQNRCCMSGLSVPRLLNASHIVPWRDDTTNRLNPSNGLCLSALHDRAFDAGLITLSDDYRIILSESIQQSDDEFCRNVLHPLAGKIIELPQRFSPSPSFIARHRTEIFIDNRAS